jgi:hypothetical protein
MSGNNLSGESPATPAGGNPQAGSNLVFAGKGVAPAESLVRPNCGTLTLGLPARYSGREAAMVAAMQGRAARKQRAGRILLAIGGTAMFLQLWALWLEAGAAWSRGASESLGWMGALGMAMLQMVNLIAWNPNGILLSLTKVLLLCWPVAVMIAGVVVSRRTN